LKVPFFLVGFFFGEKKESLKEKEKEKEKEKKKEMCKGLPLGWYLE